MGKLAVKPRRVLHPWTEALLLETPVTVKQADEQRYFH